jgi:cell division protein FtsL
LFTAVIALGALSAFLVWLDNKKHHRVKGEIMDLERQIKQLQLEKMKNGEI